MALSNTPATWGGTNTSKDYEFYMQGVTDLDQPISLAGEHMIDTPSQNLNDPIVKRVQVKVRGRLVDRELVVRVAEELSLTMNIMFGSSTETPLLVRARRGGDCRTVIAAHRLCAEEGQGHTYVFEVTMVKPARVNQIISISESALAEWQTEARADIEITLKELGAFLAVDTADALYAVSFLTEDCVTCSGDQFADAIALGGDGIGEIVILRTNDRFGSTSVPTDDGSPPTGAIGTSLYTYGDIVLGGFSTHAKTAAATGTAGGTLFSVDGGDNFTLDTNLTAPIYAVGKFGNAYLAAGGVGASGAPLLFFSENGLTWTGITSGVFPASSVFLSLAVDEIAGKIYLGALDGKVYVGTWSGTAFVFVVVTPAGSPSAIHAINILRTGFISIGGTAGYIGESVDGGLVFVQKSFGVAGVVNALAGDNYRTLAASGTKVVERSWQTLNTPTAVRPKNGLALSGTVTALAASFDRDPNFYLAVTTTGEVVFIRDNSPFS